MKKLITSIFTLGFALTAFGQMRLDVISTYRTSIFDDGAAEIVTYDSVNKQLIFSNASTNEIEFLSFANPGSLTSTRKIDMSSYGAGVNSVAAKNGIIAVAVESDPKQDAGQIVLFQGNGTLIKAYPAGALPDMVCFSNDGNMVLSANEGEPSDDYTNDPEGTVTVIDISAGAANGVVTQINFNAYDDDMQSLLNKGVRIFGPNATVSQDLEPEYIALSADDKLAFVTLQENNALGVIDLETKTVIDILPLGYKDHSNGSATIDQYVLNELVSGWPSLGTPAYDGGQAPVMLGGFSGLYYSASESSGDNHVFYAVPDRGPNDGTTSKSAATPTPPGNLRPFKLPDYQSRIAKFTVNTANGTATLDDQIMLSQSNGTPISGRGNAPGLDEVPVTYTDPATIWGDSSYVSSTGTYFHELEYDAFGGDFEGVLMDKNGDFWLCDEYRPAIYQFSSTGVLKNRYIAEGTKESVITKGFFISEYAEGSSNNKYFEFYNGTGQTINLSDYMLVNCSNGCKDVKTFEYDNSYIWAGKTLAQGETFVIAHPSAQPDILAKADTVFTYLPNGNDWWAILDPADSSIIDQVGMVTDEANEPADGWDVAGVTAATKDHTLIRKHYILEGNSDWAASAGTNTVNSEWIVDERPTADTVLPTLGTHLDMGSETLPSVYKKRRPNRGFEAIAYDADKHVIYAFIQSPIENPNNSVRNNTDVIRILGIDATDGTPVEEYVYLLERNALPGIGLSRVDKIGDAVYVGNGIFMVLERDSGLPGKEGTDSKKSIWKIDIKGATNIINNAVARKETSADPNDKTLEMMTPDELVAAGIEPVKKMLVLNVAQAGYMPSDKFEGLVMIDENTLGIINDNDFGLAGAGVSDKSALGIINFGSNYALDPSDKDDAINIANWPVHGMFMPDALTTYTYNGKTYIMTANEGDGRDYAGYSEEARVKDLTLDPTAFPNASTMQANEELGRLTITTSEGDVDGDGDYDYMLSFGARSFSVWNSTNGSLIWDSGDEFEKETADAFPDDFNSTNDENNSFESRSDNKGPEPEAIEIAEFKGTPYAVVGLERIGGMMLYDITDPEKPVFYTYVNNRDFSVVNAEISGSTNDSIGDLGVEDIMFISSTASPDGKYYLVTSNEVSGTITVFEMTEALISVPEISVNSTKFKAYPNPVNGNIIKTEIKDDFRLMDVNGRILREYTNTKTLDIRGITQGTYYLQNSTGQTIVIVRL